MDKGVDMGGSSANNSSDFVSAHQTPNLLVVLINHGVGSQAIQVRTPCRLT